VIKVLHHFFSTIVCLKDRTNDTVIVLIPKMKDAKELKDCRPISLCNALSYTSKCLVNMQVMFSLQLKSMFIPGHMITDNAIIAFECLHVMQQCNDKRGGFYANKLDLAKAYDLSTGTT
jgi:hypothetical protein